MVERRKEFLADASLLLLHVAGKLRQRLRWWKMTGTTGDVHLVVYGEGKGTVAKLLGPEPRFLLQKVTSLSVPVMILNPTLLGQLEAANKLPPKCTAASTLRGWFRQDLESAWEKLQQEHARKQEMLPLGGTGDDLPLAEG